MTGLPYKAGAVLMPFNGAPHLFAILNDPCDQGLCLVVMITTIKPDRLYDGTCVLDHGDHAFIGKPSYALYRMAETIRATHIAKMLGKGLFRPKPDFDKPVFERIADGLYTSDETRGTMLKYAKANGV